MKYIVRLGEHRGKSYGPGYLPTDMLPDGTIVTLTERSIRWVKDGLVGTNKKSRYLYINECDNFSYPLSLLEPYYDELSMLEEMQKLKTLV